MPNFSIDKQAHDALSHLQDTSLSPMNEALFKAWAKANQIKDPDSPDDHVDYRGIYEMTGGKILPNGQLNRFAQKLNSEDKLRNILQEQMVKRMQETVQSAQDKQDQFHKEERQDATHQQKMEMETLKQQNQPHEQAMKQMDLQKQELGNQGKALDVQKAGVNAEAQKEAKEAEFQKWYQQQASQLQLDPNADDPRHFYDWRAAHDAGATADEEGHWPSEYKRLGHPNLVVDGMDTRTGNPVAQSPDLIEALMQTAALGARRIR